MGGTKASWMGKSQNQETDSKSGSIDYKSGSIAKQVKLCAAFLVINKVLITHPAHRLCL